MNDSGNGHDVHTYSRGDQAGTPNAHNGNCGPRHAPGTSRAPPRSA